MKKFVLLVVAVVTVPFVGGFLYGFLYGVIHEMICSDDTCTSSAHRLSHPERF